MSVTPAATTEKSVEEFCPYKGLEPYEANDRAYFFGRERDIRTIVSNLHAAPFVILYGGSGVGKSSVLLAGVVPFLREQRGTPVVVFRTWQHADFIARLKTSILNTLEDHLGRKPEIDSGLPLSSVLMEARKVLRGPLFLILDQFEEYFLYTPPSMAPDSPDAELARAINQSSNNTNFLLSMRDDGLSKLDRFLGRIANPLGNLLRLERLSPHAAREAIEKPLEVYNQMFPGDAAPKRVEEALREGIIEGVQRGRVTIGAAGRGGMDTSPLEHGIETPYLQIVLTRVWKEERRNESNLLRDSTFHDLGEATGIVQSHLQESIRTLPRTERDLAAKAFRYLVTPSGTKIAYSSRDLAQQTGSEPLAMEGLLQRLSGPVRIIRAVASSAGETRYEIFHDVLAKAVLDWSQRRLQSQRAIRRGGLVAGVAFLGLVIVGAVGVTISESLKAEEAGRALVEAQHREEDALRTASEQKDLARKAEEARDSIASNLQSRLNEASQLIDQLSKNKDSAEALAKTYLDNFQQRDREVAALKIRAKELEVEADKATQRAMQAQKEFARARAEADQLFGKNKLGAEKSK